MKKTDPTLANTPAPEPPVVTDERAADSPTVLQQFLNHFSLRLAGMLNLVGDAGLFMSGVKNPSPGSKRDNFRLLGGAFYTLGGLNLSLFGSMSPKQRSDQMSERVGEFMEEELGGLPTDSELGQNLAQRDRSMLGRTKTMLERYPAQSTLVAYTAGAGALLASGIRKYNHGGGAAAMWYGISSVIFKVVALLVPEERPKDIKKHAAQGSDGPIDGFINWIREKPLRLFGYGSFISDSLLTYAAYQEFKSTPANARHKNGWVWTGVVSVSYMLADIMIAISHKDRSASEGKFSIAQQREIERLAADTIARQPEEVRDTLAHKTAGFLVQQPELQGSVESIEHAIKSQVKEKESWAARTAPDPNAAPQMQPATT